MNTTAVVIGFGSLMVLIALRVPVAFSLFGAGTIGLILVDGFDIAAASIVQEPYRGLLSFSLIVIPLFIVMGTFAQQSGLAEQIFRVLRNYSRALPGGLGVATIFSCSAFAAVSGSSVAAVATIGKLSVREMRAGGYTDAFSTGIVASGGTLGVLIPPSIVLVIYGQITGVSIGQMLLAGIIPGLISALAYVIYIMVRSRRRMRRSLSRQRTDEQVRGEPADGGLEGGPEPVKVGEVPRDDGESEVPDRGLFAVMFRVAILFGIVIGGIYFGLATPTESAALGALAAGIMLLIDKRESNAWIPASVRALRDATQITGVVLALLIGATLFGSFIVRAGLPRTFSAWAVDLDVPPIAIVAILLLLLIPLGMFLDGISMLLIAIPLMFPVISGLGFNGIWFGILAVKMIELGLITPPVGLNVYVVGGVANVPVERVFRGVVPFYVLDIVTVALLFALPILVTFLPEHTFG